MISPEILAGYSIQTNKNAKEELEARPAFFWGSMYPWLLELVVLYVFFLCYLKDFGSLSLPYFNTYHCLLHLWTYGSEPKQQVLSQFEFPELLQFSGAKHCLP